MKPIWYWLFPLCVVVLGVYVAYHNYPWWHDDPIDKWFGWGMGTLVTAFLAFLSVGLACGVASLIGDWSDQVWIECWRGKMVSLRSADGVAGRFASGLFMVSGYVDSRQTYFYYTLNSNGSFQPGRWKPDSDTSVFEEERQDGEVIQSKERFKHEWIAWFGDSGDRLKMEFHIPKGSLKQQFSLE